MLQQQLANNPNSPCSTCNNAKKLTQIDNTLNNLAQALTGQSNIGSFGQPQSYDQFNPSSWATWGSQDTSGIWGQSRYPWSQQDVNGWSNWNQFSKGAWGLTPTSNWDDWCSSNFNNAWADDWSGMSVGQFQQPSWVDQSRLPIWNSWNRIVNSNVMRLPMSPSQGTLPGSGAYLPSVAGNMAGVPITSQQQALLSGQQWNGQQWAPAQGNLMPTGAIDQSWGTTGQPWSSGISPASTQGNGQNWNGAQAWNSASGQNYNGNGQTYAAGNGQAWTGNGQTWSSGNGNNGQAWSSGNGQGWTGNGQSWASGNGQTWNSGNGQSWNSGNGQTWNGNGQNWNGNGQNWNGNGQNWNGNGQSWSGNGQNWNSNGQGWSGNGQSWNGQGWSGNGQGYGSGAGVTGAGQCAELTPIGTMTNATLTCPAGQVIQSVTQAAWGQSAGTCQSPVSTIGTCTSDVSTTVSRMCINQNVCSFGATTTVLGVPVGVNGQQCQAGAMPGQVGTMQQQQQPTGTNTIVTRYTCGIGSASLAPNSLLNFKPSSASTKTAGAIAAALTAIVAVLLA